MAARQKPDGSFTQWKLTKWAQVPNTAAKTPVGLPIASSAYNKAIAKLLLKRMLPLPVQIGLELYEFWKSQNQVPAGWTQICTTMTPAAQHLGYNYYPGNNVLNACGLQQAFTGGNPATARSADDISVLVGFLNARVKTRWNGPPLAPGVAPTKGSPLLPMPLPDVVPPEWRRPDLAPELVPPTAPQVSPEKVPYNPTRVDPFPWQDPHYGTNRGPRNAPDYNPYFEPLPDYPSAAPGPAPGYTPWTVTDPAPWPWAEPAFAPQPAPSHSPGWPTLPGRITIPAPGRSPTTRPRPAPNRGPVSKPEGLPVPVPLPTPAIVPVVQTRGPVSIRIDPPGWTRQQLAPPRKGEKERKFIASVPPGAASRIISGVTEGLDLVKCLHDALPKQHQAKPRKRVRNPHAKGTDMWADFQENNNRYLQPTFLDRAKAVYKAWDKSAEKLEANIEHGIDPATNYVLSANNVLNAVVECGKEQLKDRFYAMLGRAGGTAGRKLGLSHGFGLGGAVRQDVTGGFTPLRGT